MYVDKYIKQRISANEQRRPEVLEGRRLNFVQFCIMRRRCGKADNPSDPTSGLHINRLKIVGRLVSYRQPQILHM